MIGFIITFLVSFVVSALVLFIITYLNDRQIYLKSDEGKRNTAAKIIKKRLEKNNRIR